MEVEEEEVVEEEEKEATPSMESHGDPEHPFCITVI